MPSPTPEPTDETTAEPKVEVIEAATKLVPGVVQCRRCTNCWPKSEIQLNDKKPNYGLCRYCIAQQRTEIIDRVIAKRAEELSQGLLAEKGVAGAGMAKVEEFIGALDLKLGGIHQMANRFGDIIIGLQAKGAFATAGQLLLQLQKLRLSVQKQHHVEDFSQLSLKQKQDKLRVALLQLVADHRLQADQEKLTKTVEAAMGLETDIAETLESELANES